MAGGDAVKGLRLVFGVLLWILVLGLTGIPVSHEGTRNLIAGSGWLTSGIVIQLTMLTASIILILALGRGRFGGFGFRTASRVMIKRAFIVGSIAAVAVHIVAGVLRELVPASAPHPAMGGSSFLQVVIGVWIIASVCEEVLHRGLIQSFLEPLGRCGFTVSGVRLSLPVVTAALLFGFMHTMLLTMGADAFFVGCVVASAVVLGLVAGYYREKSGSLLPAVLVHMVFNVYGGVLEYFRNWLIR
jgi:membrane protease YdiL (CAAX protease family)